MVENGDGFVRSFTKDQGIIIEYYEDELTIYSRSREFKCFNTLDKQEAIELFTRALKLLQDE